MRGWARNSLLVLAIVLHAAVGYIYAVSGLAAPMWALVPLLFVWGLLAGQFISITRRGRSPWLYLAVPGAAAALWILVVPGLGTLLDWTP
jgi:hypothetical protein